jgi:translation initiation factor 2 alpha subunit (eIF-2alpha)
MGGVAEACAGLRRAMGDLLTRMATLHSSKKNQTVFLINNYDLILKVLHEFNIQSEEVIKFSALCDEQIASFVDQELTHHYGRMIKFVETVKAKLAQTASPREINVDKDKCEKLIEDFGATWKAVFVQLSGEVMNFSNFIKGAEILRRVLMELAVLYKSFSDIVKTYHKDLSKNLVPDPTLTYEIKKYSRSFD